MNSKADDEENLPLMEVLAERDRMAQELARLTRNLSELNQRLHESQSHLNHAQAVARIGSWHLDIEKQRLTWSNETYRMFGVPPGTPQDVDSFASHVYPEDLASVFDAWGKALRGESEYDMEHRIVVDGQLRWVRERAEVLRAEDGTPVAGVGTVQDITRRKETELALEAERARLNAILHGAKDGILIADATTRQFVDANPAICDMLGYTGEEILTLGVEDIPTEAARAYLQQHLNDRLDEGPTVSEHVPLHKRDGTTCYVDINVSRLESQGRVFLAGFFRDITQRVEDMERLRIHEERLRLALESAKQDWFDLDLRTGEIAVGESYPRMLGYEPREFHGHYRQWIEGIHPMDRPLVLEQFNKMRDSDDAIDVMEYRCKAKSGDWVWFDTVGKAIQRDSAGKPTRLIGIHTDVTLRKHRQRESTALLRRIEALIMGMGDRSGGDGGNEQESTRLMDQAKQLSARQREILILVAEGHTSAEIARRLNVAYQTVVTHRRNLMGKLGLHTTADLTRFAMQCRLISN